MPGPPRPKGRKADDDEGNDSGDAGHEQRTDEKPGRRADDAGAGNRAADIAENPAQERADGRHRDEQNQGEGADIETVGRRCRAPLHRRQGLALAHYADDAIDAGLEAGCELSLAEQRRDGLGDDAVRGDVGQHALQPVADLDAHLLIVLGDDQNRAVVLALLSDAPCLGEADRVCLDGFRAGGRYHEDRELIGGARLPIGELGLQRLTLRRRQGIGQIGDPRLQRR